LKMRKLLTAALVFFLSAAGLCAQGQRIDYANPLGGNITVQDAGVCSTSGSFLWQHLPTNASTTTVNLAGTFAGTLTIRLSNNGGGSWTTNSTTTTAGTTSISTNGFTDICADVTTYTSGSFAVTITTGLNTGPQGPAGPAGSGSGSAAAPGIDTVGLIADYQFKPGETVASLPDHSGAGNNVTGTDGTPPTIIPVTGGIPCNGLGSLLTPAALNAGVTFQFFVGYQNTVGVSSTNDQSYFGGDGNNTVNNAIQFMLSLQGKAGSPGVQPAAADQVIKLHNSYTTASLDVFYGNDVITWALGANDILYQGQTLSTSGNGNIFGTSAGGQTAGVFHICGNAAGHGNTNVSYFSGQIYRILVYNILKNGASIAQNVNAMRESEAALGVPTFANQTGLVNNLADLGDSIFVTNGLSTSPVTSLSLYDAWNITNQAISGTTTCGMVPNIPQTIFPLYSPNATRNVFILATDSNDIAQATPNYLAVLQCQRQAIQSAHNIGWKVLTTTMLDRGGVSAQKNTWNTLKRQMWANIGADGLIDFAAIPQLGADGANANGTYFQDTIHPTATGVALMQPAVSFIVNRLFGNSSNSGSPVTAKNQAIGTFLQQITLNDASNLLCRSLTFNSPNYPGSLLTLVSRVNFSTVTDTNGNAWAQRAAFGGGGLWDAVNAKGGEPNTVTACFSSANGGWLVLSEYTGVTASPFDVQASNSGNSTTPSGGTPTTTVASDLVIGAGWQLGGGTVTAGAGFTLRSTPTNGTIFSEDEIFVGPGAVTATATLSAGGAWNMITAAYKTVANTTYPMGAQDITLLCSPAGGNQTINLPEAQYLAGGGTFPNGATVTIKNIQTAGANTCTVAGINSETIDGAATITVANKATLILKAVLVSPSAAGANWVQLQNN
jgi:hypothetical protein